MTIPIFATLPLGYGLNKHCYDSIYSFLCMGTLFDRKMQLAHNRWPNTHYHKTTQWLVIGSFLKNIIYLFCSSANILSYPISLSMFNLWLGEQAPAISILNGRCVSYLSMLNLCMFYLCLSENRWASVISVLNGKCVSYLKGYCQQEIHR